MDTNNIKKLSIRWEHLTDNELEFVSQTTDVRPQTNLPNPAFLTIIHIYGILNRIKSVEHAEFSRTFYQILERCTRLEELNISESSKLAAFVTDKSACLRFKSSQSKTNVLPYLVIPVLTANCQQLKSLGAFFPITDVGIGTSYN